MWLNGRNHAGASCVFFFLLLAIFTLSFGCADDSNSGSVNTEPADTSADATAGEVAEDGGLPQEDGQLDVTEVSDSEETPVEIQTFPVTQTGENGVSDALEFVTTEDTAAFVISAVGNAETFYVIEDLVGPDGRVLLSAGWTQDPSNFGGAQLCLNCEIRAAAGESAHAVLVPNTPVGKSGQEVSVLPGTYRFRVAAYQLVGGGGFQPPTVQPVDSAVNVTVALQQVAVTQTPQLILDFNLHFTGAKGMTAAVAQTDPRLQEALTKIASTYAQAEIQLGEVRYFDMETSIQSVESMTGPGNDFEALARLTEESPPGVNLIFVREIVESSSPLGGFGVILGVSGGIPGPVGVQGSGRSAVIIALEEAEAAGPVPGIGHTMAHEVGHYLGLFHSSEIPFLGIHDPLPDTPENDQQNLMYFSGTGDTLTPQQLTVLRNNPWVHP